MKRFLITAAAATAILAGLPAHAQMGGDNKNSMDSMTCQQMMDKGNMSMGSMSDGSKKTMMMGEMDMAKKSMAASKESDCKMHMKKAMGMM